MSGRADALGMFRRRGYEPLPPQMLSAEEIQIRNNAVGHLVVQMQLADTPYHPFQHNGQSAVFMRTPGGDDYHLSFHNGHRSQSRFQRFLHPAEPFQFDINGATNEVVQTRGPVQLNQGQIVAALQAIHLGL